MNLFPFYLKKKGLIESDEVRLPLTAISDELKEELNIILSK